MKRNFIFNAFLFLFVLGFGKKSIGQTYCNSNFTNVTWEYVKNVTYGGINNTTGGTVGGPVNYLSLGPANVTVGTASNLSVTIQVDGSEYVFAFIDWNHNGTLNDAGEVYTLATSTSSPGPFTVSVTPPPGAYIGTTRMRVMLAFANATPSPCLNSTYGEAEDYTVNVQAAVNCSTVTFPVSAGVTVTPTAICVSGNVTMNMTTPTAMPSASGITYKWQSSAAAGGPFVDIPGAVTTVPTYTTTTPITTTTYYKCVVLCNASTTVITSSASAAVVVTNPGTPTVTGANRCGPGSVTLSAVPPSGSTINWYTTATGGSPVGTSTTYTTNFLPTTTTFYAAAASGSSSATPQIGTGTGSLADYENGGPFSNYYRGQTAQYLYTAAEIIASGGGAGTINTIAFNCTGIPVQLSNGANTVLPNYKLYIMTVPSTVTTLSWQAAASFTPIYTNAAYSPTLGWNTCNLTVPFNYNGVDNIIICMCYDQTSPGYSNGMTQGKHQFTTVSNRMMYFQDDGVASGCGQTGTLTSTNLPNVRLGMTLGCVGPRQAVVATINPSPAITIAKPAVVCSGEIGTIVAASAPMTNYTTYAWTPNVADLYTNTAATTPYMSGSSPTAYFKSTVSGAHTYYLFSSGATPAACTHADTISIWVQPDSVSVKAVPDSICVTGNTTLSLLPATGYAPNSIQWQESTDGGATYGNILGATNLTYTTAIISANRFYRALIKSTNDTCEMPVKQVVVVNPQLLSVTDSFNCGPGTVTLNAQTGGNASAKWYAAATGGSSIGSGSPWITPSLNASQTYYVAAEGSSSTNVWQIGTGTGSYGGASSAVGPFSVYYQRYSQQYLYTAAEMAAAGATPGVIAYMALNCTSLPSMTIPNYTIKIKFVPSSLVTLTWQTALTQVYTTATFMPVVGWNTFQFTGPAVVWNGTDNIVFEVCHTQTSGWTSSGNHQYTTKTGRFLANNSDDPGSSCGVAGSSTSTYLPNIKMGRPPCETPRQAVHANIYPKPAVDLGPDVNMCVDAGSSIVLDAGVQPNTPAFLWDNGTTSQVRAVNATGTYNVKVTNTYTCAESDTVNIVLRKNPSVHLGNDTTVCNGVTLTLNPGNGGIDYFWNTGQTGQTINVNSAGSYSVFVTNNEGCTSTDTISVLMQGELPTVQGIQVSNNGAKTFHFTAVYPQNVVGYEWDFGDGSLPSYEASPTHVYDSVGDYIVILHLSSTCGFANDTISAHIVGIRQLAVNNDELTVYPNPSNGLATILNKGDLKMEKIEVYSILGQVIYRSKADSKDKHVIDLSSIASGIYTIEVYTDKGTVARKLEIIR